MTLEEAIKHTKDIVKDVSECTDCRMEHKQLTGWLEELLTYRKIGTPEEYREAVTKQISRHPVDKTKPDSGYGNYYENARVIVCPNCNGRLKLKSKGKYCDKCGQKLSWSDYERED